MTTTAYNAQFLQLDFRLLDNDDFLAFLRSSASAVYLLLLRHIWRGRREHPIALVNELRRAGFLVAAVDRERIAARLRIGDKRYVSRLLGQLEKQGLVERKRTGRQSVFVLGSWEDRSFSRDGSFIDETLFLYRCFGPDGGGGSRAEVDSQSTSEVDKTSTSEVDKMSTSFLIEKEIEKEIEEKGREGSHDEDEDDGVYVVRIRDLARTA